LQRHESALQLPGGEDASAGQPVAERPAPGLKVSTGASAQGPPLAPVHPGPHWQALGAVEASGESALAGQPRHGWPPPEPYVFSRHAAHGPPGGPLKPGTHPQSVAASLPSAETLCAGHPTQSVAAAVALYVPASQGEQPIEPSALLYEPAAHGAHAVPATEGVTVAEVGCHIEQNSVQCSEASEATPAVDGAWKAAEASCMLVPIIHAVGVWKR